MGQIVDSISSYLGRYFTWISIPKIMWTDVVEIVVIAYLLYNLLLWVKNTRAWSLMKGVLIILIFVFIGRTVGVIGPSMEALVAIVVVFQPELRKALEQIGRKNILTSLFAFDSTRVTGELFSDHTISEIVRASFLMGREKTGALIVIENNDTLIDYEKTGIILDSVVSSRRFTVASALTSCSFSLRQVSVLICAISVATTTFGVVLLAFAQSSNHCLSSKSVS